jgi:hypothetical protein
MVAAKSSTEMESSRMQLRRKRRCVMSGARELLALVMC